MNKDHPLDHDATRNTDAFERFCAARPATGEPHLDSRADTLDERLARTRGHVRRSRVTRRDLYATGVGVLTTSIAAVVMIRDTDSTQMPVLDVARAEYTTEPFDAPAPQDAQDILSAISTEESVAVMASPESATADTEADMAAADGGLADSEGGIDSKETEVPLGSRWILDVFEPDDAVAHYGIVTSWLTERGVSSSELTTDGIHWSAPVPAGLSGSEILSFLAELGVPHSGVGELDGGLLGQGWIVYPGGRTALWEVFSPHRDTAISTDAGGYGGYARGVFASATVRDRTSLDLARSQTAAWTIRLETTGSEVVVASVAELREMLASGVRQRDLQDIYGVQFGQGVIWPHEEQR